MKQKKRQERIPQNPHFELSEAREKAHELSKEISPYCKLMKVGGEVRMGRKYPQNIHIVCVPKMYDVVRNFNHYRVPHKDFVDRVNEYKVVKGHPARDWTVEIQLPNQVPYVLHIVKEECVGLAILLSTGPEIFNGKVRKALHKKGYEVKDYYVKNDHEFFSFPDEESIFRFLGWDYIKPAKRKKYLKREYLNQ